VIKRERLKIRSEVIRRERLKIRSEIRKKVLGVSSITPSTKHTRHLTMHLISAGHKQQPCWAK